MILLDTSALIEALREKGQGDIRARVGSALRSGEAVICEPVLLELYQGARGAKEIQMVKEYENVLTQLKCTDQVWKTSFSHAQKLRKKGVTVPNIDILIYSISRFYRADLLSCDGHFTKIIHALE